jgi:hypothetical protein
MRVPIGELQATAPSPGRASFVSQRVSFAPPQIHRCKSILEVHTLTGDRRGTWSLSVTRNHRLTFTINDGREIRDVKLEDYH